MAELGENGQLYESDIDIFKQIYTVKPPFNELPPTLVPAPALRPH